MVINMDFRCQYIVTDIKQTCLGQGLGVTITARKRTSKLGLRSYQWPIYNIGHTLPSRQNWTFASNSRCCYFKKSHVNHSIKQLTKFAK